MTATHLSALLICTALGQSEAEKNLKAFPPAGEGMVRFVLFLPEQKDETAFQVELQVGKVVKVDGVNRQFFGGKIQKQTVEGWGFPRFVVKELGPMSSTLIGVDPSQPLVERFITLGGEPFLLRYNSRLPIVVYVPEGVEVRQRIWRADKEVQALEKG